MFVTMHGSENVINFHVLTKKATIILIKVKCCNAFSCMLLICISLFVCLFSWCYNPLWLYFHSPVAGFSLLVFEVSRLHTTTRHSR